MNCNVSATFAFAQPLQKVLSEKHGPLYSIYNGVHGELTINLDPDLVNKISMVTGLDQSPEGQYAHIAYRMFRKVELEVETEDV